MPGQPMVATGSWDKVSRSPCRPRDGALALLLRLRRALADSHLPPQTLRYWNLTAQTPVATVQLPERCYCTFFQVSAARRRRSSRPPLSQPWTSPTLSWSSEPPNATSSSSTSVRLLLVEPLPFAELTSAFAPSANPTTPHKSIPSPLKMQTRSIACFPDGTGYSVGSIEGRVAVQHIDEAKTSSNFSFKVCCSHYAL